MKKAICYHAPRSVDFSVAFFGYQHHSGNNTSLLSAENFVFKKKKKSVSISQLAIPVPCTGTVGTKIASYFIFQKESTCTRTGSKLARSWCFGKTRLSQHHHFHNIFFVLPVLLLLPMQEYCTSCPYMYIVVSLMIVSAWIE
jgi:hypothetical protein